MDTPLHSIAETAGYLRDCDEAGVTIEERAEIVDRVAQAPTAGDIVQGSGGVFKRRFAGKGRGKSGGYRVIVAFIGEEAPVYLLALLSKGNRANFSNSEITGFKSLTTELKQYWENRRRRR